MGNLRISIGQMRHFTDDFEVTGLMDQASIIRATPLEKVVLMTVVSARITRPALFLEISI